MPYSCADIMLMMISDSEDPAISNAVVSHLDSCAVCRTLIELDPKLESGLRLLSPTGVAVDFTDPVMVRIRRTEKSSAPAQRMEKIIRYAAAAVSILPIAMILAGWDDFIAAVSKINFSPLLSDTSRLINNLNIPVINLTRIGTYLGETPLIPIALTGLTALIWAFSIMEFEKTSK